MANPKKKTHQDRTRYQSTLCGDGTKICECGRQEKDCATADDPTADHGDRQTNLKPSPPPGFALWVKRLGQCHLFRIGLTPSDQNWGTTVCGAPMLGDHYGDHPDMQKCFRCWAAVGIQ